MLEPLLEARVDQVGAEFLHIHDLDLVLTMVKSPVRSVEVRAGSRLHADFGPLGTIDLTFA